MTVGFWAGDQRDVVAGDYRLALVDITDFPGGANPSVCGFTHGLAASRDYWNLTLPALLATHRMLAEDLPSSGYSENRQRYGPLEIVRTLVELLDRENITIKCTPNTKAYTNSWSIL
jgi:pimeloyl-ACP methyl ester carboxylesterase